MLLESIFFSHVYILSQSCEFNWSRRETRAERTRRIFTEKKKKQISFWHLFTETPAVERIPPRVPGRVGRTTRSSPLRSIGTHRRKGMTFRQHEVQKPIHSYSKKSSSRIPVRSCFLRFISWFSGGSSEACLTLRSGFVSPALPGLVWGTSSTQSYTADANQTG